MQDFLEQQPDRLTLFSEACEVSYGKYLPDIHPDEAEKVVESCENEFRENIITCKTPNKELFVDEVNGLSLETVSLRNTINDLPSYIPVLDKRSSKKIILPKEYEYVAVSLTDILRSGVFETAGGLREANNISFNTDILKNQAFAGKKVILFMTGTDTLIEWVWHERHKINLYQTLAQMGFHAVTGINFSVMIGECAMAQSLNIKRSLYSSMLVQKIGLQPIPHVYAVNDRQISRWIKWFKANTGVRLCTMNCQFQRSDEIMKVTVNTLSKLLDALPELHVLLQGFQMEHAKKLGKYSDRLHFADTTASKYTQSKRRIHPQGLAQFDLQSTPNQLFSNNLKSRTAFIKNKF